jgi:hypothetical protein
MEEYGIPHPQIGRNHKGQLTVTHAVWRFYRSGPPQSVRETEVIPPEEYGHPLVQKFLAEEFLAKEEKAREAEKAAAVKPVGRPLPWLDAEGLKRMVAGLREAEKKHYARR